MVAEPVLGSIGFSTLAERSVWTMDSRESLQISLGRGFTACWNFLFG